MQLLSEEFFGKTFEHINGINILIIRWIIKFVFYLILGLIVTYVLISIYSRDFLPVVIISGLFILGEVAHYLRKTREKVMVSRVTEKNSLNEKAKNKTLISKPKNKTLVKKKKVNI